MATGKSNSTAGAASSGPADGDFVITRVFDAPASLVFKAWTDPEHMARWWGPRIFTTPVCDMDVRPGGAYRIVMRRPDGVDYPITGIFREIVEPLRIVMTMDCSEHPAAWHDMVRPNRGKGDDNPAGIMVSTVTFEERDAKTTLTVRIRFESMEISRAMNKMGMTEGWSQSLDRLGELVSADHLNGSKKQETRKMSTKNDTGPGSSSKGFTITRTFDAPRELVWKAWTERDRLMQWFGPKGFTMPVATLDFRPGGSLHYCLQSADGMRMWGKFVYREIVPPERIVLVNSFSDEKGGLTRHPMSPTWPREMLSTTTFTEHEGRTTITLQWEPLNASEEERKTFDTSHDSMTMGWTGTFDQLADYLAKT